MKYLYINDISYLIKKRYKLLIALFLMPIVVLLINISVSMPVLDHINGCMGTNLDLEEYVIIEILMFLFNIFIYTFFIADLYVKDIAYQLDNIFLRMKPAKWITLKNIVIILLTILIKIIQYAFIAITLLIFKKTNILTFLGLMIKDILYTIVIQFIFITLYVINRAVKKNKYIAYIIFIIIMVFIPKNIYNLNYITISCFTIILFLLITILQIIFKKNNKKIIENI